MTIRLTRLEEDINVPQPVIIRVDTASWKAFQELVQRGANLWPDAPAAIKRFADDVTTGHAQQSYFDHSETQLNTAPERK